MFANVQSDEHKAFTCRIKAEPIHAYRNILVYELVDSSFPNDITKTVNGENAETFRHIALDTDGIGYLFDIKNKKIAGAVGRCSYIGDSVTD